MADLPRVTDILSNVLGKCAWYTPEARFRGKLIHALIHKDTLGHLDPDVLALKYPNIVGYVHAAREVRESLGSIQYVEHEVCDPHGLYMGHVDLIIRPWEEMDQGIVDYKCGEPEPWHPLQTEAYARCVGARFRWCVYLNEDGTYKIVPHTDDKQDEADWHAVLAVYWCKQRRKMND